MAAKDSGEYVVFLTNAEFPSTYEIRFIVNIPNTEEQTINLAAAIVLPIIFVIFIAVGIALWFYHKRNVNPAGKSVMDMLFICG